MFYCFAENSFNFSIFESTEGKTAVLVLVPGTNGNGALFLENQPWIEFAQKHSLGIIALNYQSAPQDFYFGNRKNYYFPLESGSGKALLDEIKNVYGKDLPILIYGVSGGAEFVSQFADYAPERIIAWCAYSAYFYETPKTIPHEKTQARGIIACGELDHRMQCAYSYFYIGRQQNKNWIWVNLKKTGHVRSKALEEFACLFFSTELDIFKKPNKAPHKDIFADISTMNIISSEHSEMNKSLSCPFRNETIYKFWKKIHTP